MKISTGTTIALVVAGVTLAYHISNRLSADALNVVVGLSCGIATCVPIALGLLMALTKRLESSKLDRVVQEDEWSQPYYGRRQQLPQFVMMAPAGGQYPQVLGSFTNPGAGFPIFAGERIDRQENRYDGREWRIIGDDS